MACPVPCSASSASLFAELVVEKGVTDPAAILEGAREGMVRMMNRQDDEQEQHDGMNASVVSLDRETLQLEYAGAYAPLYIVRNGALIEHKGDRLCVGHQEGGVRPFQKIEIQLQPGDRLFLFSDGLQDQFGGPQGRKLRSSGVKEWLADTAQLPIDDQYQALSDRFRQWKGDQEQTDDVLLIGLQV
jgi:serine phosphatase RsbU (regulator of sigma subunit)